MDHKQLRIIFMGTPEFAVASLEALLKAEFQVVGVVTAPDKPAGRGLKLQESAVKKFAVEKGLTILQPTKLKDEIFQQELRALKADIQIVVAFRMLPEAIWNMPSMGTVNVHGSLLPQYRGAAPINWAVINGEKQTGVTTFKLKHEIDTGDILLRDTIDISETDTAGSLHDKMKEVGAALLVKTVKGLAEGNLKEQPQPMNADLKHAPKIFTETCKIDWTKSTKDVYNLIRGLSPFPGAFSYLNDKIFKIYFGTKEITSHSEQPGSFVTDGKTFLKFAAADGYIHATDVQPEGKKRMKIEDFLRGFRQ